MPSWARIVWIVLISGYFLVGGLSYLMGKRVADRWYRNHPVPVEITIVVPEGAQPIIVYQGDTVGVLFPNINGTRTVTGSSGRH